LKRVFDSAGITIPWPIRTLDFKDERSKKIAEEISKADIPLQTVEQPQNIEINALVKTKTDQQPQKKPQDTGAEFLEKASSTFEN
ncbi:hypothetical protein HZA41_00345, partial [Candidatus Peregrinibacteria bacterium]|nr:hypothetical protein [Candidatus Peregrinibacteria bacterium]